MSDKITTTAGELKKVTLEEFIAELKLELCVNLVTQYDSTVNFGVSENSYVSDEELPNEEDSTYFRRAVVLTENSIYQQLLHLLNQVNFIKIEGVTRGDRIENAVVESMNNSGVPTHVVEISYDCYGIFCIEDFKYKLMNPTRGALICYAPNRNLIFRVGLV